MRIFCIFSFLFFFSDTLFLYIRSYDHFYTYIVLILFICGCMFLHLPYMCCFFSLFIHMFLILVCNLLFLFYTKMP